MKFEIDKSYYEMYYNTEGYGVIKLYIIYGGWNYKGSLFKKQKIYYIENNKIKLISLSRGIYKTLLFNLVDEREFTGYKEFMKEYRKFKKELIVRGVIE